MDNNPAFLDSNGHCILRIPGDCVYYSGHKFKCGPLYNGLNFNKTVQRLIKCIDETFPNVGSTTTTTSTSSTTSTSTSSTTSTSTSSTSTSSTTSTSTTSTSTSSTSSTSTTTTSTTTIPGTAVNIYWGAQTGATPPNAAAVIAQLSNQQNPAGAVIVNWTSFAANPRYCWAAIPSGYPKTHWYDTPLNMGNIGTDNDLFGAPTTVVISGVNYLVYITQYQTQFTEQTELRP